MKEDKGNAVQSMFRATKRRKILRKRAESEDGVRGTNSEGRSGIDGTVTSLTQPGDEDPATGVVRPIHIPRRKLGERGSGFATLPVEKNDNKALVVAAHVEIPVTAVNGRFVPPTGRVGPVEDKHMVAYIDSKLADLRSSSTTPNTTISPYAAPPTTTHVAAPPDTLLGLDPQSAAQGNILEIDLDAWSSRRNADRASKTRISANNNSEAFSGSKKKRRPRNQPPERSSEAVARDSLVDQVLRESHIPIYQREQSPPELDTKDAGTDEAFAEAFRQEFMAAVEEKNLRAKPPMPPGAVTKGGKVVEVARGPKLGGSRAQRERMKAAEEEKAKAGRK